MIVVLGSRSARLLAALYCWSGVAVAMSREPDIWERTPAGLRASSASDSGDECAFPSTTVGPLAPAPADYSAALLDFYAAAPLFLIWLFDDILNIWIPSFMLLGLREPREFLDTRDLSLRWSPAPCIGGARFWSFSPGDTPSKPSFSPEAAGASPCGIRSPCVSWR
jgi:hypothetical protein